jgi:hypothetical protein
MQLAYKCFTYPPFSGYTGYSVSNPYQTLQIRRERVPQLVQGPGRCAGSISAPRGCHRSSNSIKRQGNANSQLLPLFYLGSDHEDCRDPGIWKMSSSVSKRRILSCKGVFRTVQPLPLSQLSPAPRLTWLSRRPARHCSPRR